MRSQIGAARLSGIHPREREIEMEKSRLATMYSVSFQGVFGRNRSAKWTSAQPCEVEPTITIADPTCDGPGCMMLTVDLPTLASEYARKIGAKRGNLRVTRYDDCEILPDGIAIIPITQGVSVYAETIARGREVD